VTVPPLETQPPCSNRPRLPIALLLRIGCPRLLAVNDFAINTLAALRPAFEDLKTTDVALPDSDLLSLRSLKMHRLLLTQTTLLTCLMK
jgi:hypothetical protein